MPGNVITMIKLQIPGGQANPAPPVGPALGQHSVNIMEFCKAFNAKTADQNGRIIPVEISVYEDRSFTFITKTPPAAVLIKEALGRVYGSGEPNRIKVGVLSQNDLRSIAEIKMPDLNALDVGAAMKVIAGTARSMGVLVQGIDSAATILEFEEEGPPPDVGNAPAIDSAVTSAGGEGAPDGDAPPEPASEEGSDG